MQTRTVKWKVSLSNGETVYEGKGAYAVIPGEASPWNRLQQYITEQNLRISSLSLYTDANETFNLPSAGKNPRFHAFSLSGQPLSFNFFGVIGQDINTTEEEHYIVAEAKYETCTLQLWVSNTLPRNCWSLVIPLSYG